MFSKIFIVALALVSAQAAPNFFKHIRIVGGHKAAPSEFPHQISLQYENLAMGIPRQHVCGGSILNELWIMSAGHCVTELPSGGNYHVVAGINNLEESGQEIKVTKHVVHPKYQGGVNPNDVSLMKLATPLKFNDKVKSINLPNKNAVPTGMSTLSGWGSTSSTSFPEYPKDLQTADLPLLSYSECSNALKALTGTSRPLTDTNTCTGPLTGGQSACSGDSGGPLITYNNKVATQVGIVSWGMIPCGTRGAPSVYTRVSAFIDFIENTILMY